MKHSFSIIIVTWNGLELLQKFLPSVVETEYESFEIIIADNASDDNTREWIKENYPECKVVTFDINHGYCGGNNRAIKYSSGDILLFLNNDVSVEKSWLTSLDRCFRDSDADILQPKIRSYNQPDSFEYAGAAGGMIDKMAYPFCKGRIFDHVEKDRGQYDTPSPIFWASGAALAIRKKTFQQLGKFDEDFEFHMEEIDLCWRAWKNGYKVQSCPESVVYHLGGGSLPMDSSRKVYYNYRNSLLMMTKNSSSGILALKIFFRLVLDGIAGVRSLLQKQPGATWAIIRAHFAYYLRLPKTLKKRKIIQRASKHTIPEGLVYPKLLIVQAFLRGKKRYQDLN